MVSEPSEETHSTAAKRFIKEINHIIKLFVCTSAGTYDFLDERRNEADILTQQLLDGSPGNAYAQAIPEKEPIVFALLADCRTQRLEKEIEEEQ